MANTTVFKSSFLTNYWKFLLVSLVLGFVLFFMDEGGKALQSMPGWGEIALLFVFILLTSILISVIQALVFSIWKNSLLSTYVGVCVGIPLGILVYMVVLPLCLVLATSGQ